jgi:hypothetical protein
LIEGDSMMRTGIRIGGQAMVAAMAAALLGMPAAATPVATQAAAQAAKWPVYANARYGYRVCYPPRLLKAEAEAPNGDGRRFSGARGATLRVWGSNNALDQTVAASAADERARLSENGKVTYAVVRPTWFVLSGQQNGQVFYLKSVLARNAFSTMELRYPAGQTASWSPVAAQVSRCFSAG